MPAGYQYVEITLEWIAIQFDQTVKTATIVNENFKLFDGGTAEPYSFAEVPDAFKVINLDSDYVSTSRTLMLKVRYNFWLPGHRYKLEIRNLQTPFGNPVLGLPITYEFDTPTDILVDPVVPAPPIQPIDVEDTSLIDPPSFTDDTTDDDEDTATPGNTFKIVDVTPALSDNIQLDALANSGKITIKFSHKPAANFVNSSDFKLQKKAVGAGFSKWETVNTVVAADSITPTVNVYLPSVETPVVYSYAVGDDDSYTFWQPGYKYRLVLNKTIGY
jgi:hypothetical protein